MKDQIKWEIYEDARARIEKAEKRRRERAEQKKSQASDASAEEYSEDCGELKITAEDEKSVLLDTCCFIMKM